MGEYIEVHEGSGNVFKDLGYEDPDEVLAKARLVHRINTYIEKESIPLDDLCIALDVRLPVVEMITKGRLSGLGLEDLVLYTATLVSMYGPLT